MSDTMYSLSDLVSLFGGVLVGERDVRATGSVKMVEKDKYMIDLNGKRALVTGASRGIGAAIALALAESGADI
ncbi:hypothetical protein ACNF5E_25695, partial [Escherichia coli]